MIFVSFQPDRQLISDIDMHPSVFETLQPLDIAGEKFSTPLELGPIGELSYGKLPNGLT